MSLATSGLKFCCLAITFCTLASCSSKLIRLGDQTPLADSAGGNGVGGAAGNPMVVGPGSDGGAAGSSEACAHRQVLASEVLWIGDSWITIPVNTQREVVRKHALEAKAIDDGDDYYSLATAAANMAAVAKQYDTRESGATKVKVLLMDGGTWDPIAAQMSPGSSSATVAAAIDSSISTFQLFLGKVASDGTVEHIVYFLVPELPGIPGVATMRPRLQQACAESSVPCHFIDLQPYWQGHPEYTATGIQASEAGATVLGNLIWATMQDHCIAQ
jgi:hypothetical protein